MAKPQPPLPKTRKAVIMILLPLGFTYQEIANVLGCGNSTVRSDATKLCMVRRLSWDINKRKPRGQKAVILACTEALKCNRVHNAIAMKAVRDKINSPTKLSWS